MHVVAELAQRGCRAGTGESGSDDDDGELLRIQRANELVLVASALPRRGGIPLGYAAAEDRAHAGAVDLHLRRGKCMSGLGLVGRNFPTGVVLTGEDLADVFHLVNKTQLSHPIWTASGSDALPRRIAIAATAPMITKVMRRRLPIDPRSTATFFAPWAT